MGLYGDFGTMPVGELLRWVETCGRTGTLEVERGKIIKRLTFREGRVVGCSSNDPHTLLGQFLLSRDAITEDALKAALHRQERTGENLAEILKHLEVITENEITAFVDAKIEEVIYGLFDSEDAVFRFEGDTPSDPYAVPVDLGVEDVLRRGLRRSDERKRSRKVIKDPGIVFRHTGRSYPPELSCDPMATRVYELIDGNRTVADIVLHSRGPRFQVEKLLRSMLNSGIVEIAGARPGPPAPATASVKAEAVEKRPAAPAPTRTTARTKQKVGKRRPKRQYRILPCRPFEGARELRTGIKVALQLIASGQPDAALELLDTLSKALPGDETLGQLVANAEEDFRETMLAGELRPSNMPRRTPSAGPRSGEALSPEETFLLGKIDGKSDFKTLLWLAPMRDVVALKALGQLLKRGLIEVRQAA